MSLKQKKIGRRFFIALVILVISLDGCKQRHSSLASDGAPSEDDLFLSDYLKVLTFEVFAERMGFQTNKHAAFADILGVVDNWSGGRISDASAYIKYFALGQLAARLAENKFDHLVISSDPNDTNGGLQVDHAVLLSRFSFPAQNFSVCYSYASCDAALNSLSQFAKAGHLSGTGAEDLFNQRVNQLNADFAQLPRLERNRYLPYRLKSIVAAKSFHTLTLFRPLRMPRFDGSITASNPNVVALRSNLVDLIQSAESQFLAADDYDRVGKQVSTRFYSDFATPVSPIPGQVYSATEEMLQIAMAATVIGKDVPNNPGIPSKNDLTAVMESQVEAMTKVLLDAHAYNWAMLLYLGYGPNGNSDSSIVRLSNANIEPWLMNIKNFASLYTNWYSCVNMQPLAAGEDVKTRSEACSKSLKLTPFMAYKVLSFFSDYESMLPFRRSYLTLMEQLADLIYPNQTNGKNTGRLQEIRQHLAVMQQLVPGADNRTIALMRQLSGFGAGYMGLDLTGHETELAKFYPASFDSLLAEYEIYLENKIPFLQVAEQMAGKFKNFDPTVKLPPEQQESLGNLQENYKRFTIGASVF